MGKPDTAMGLRVVVAVLAALTPWWADEAVAADRYRVELLVFRNTDSAAEPAAVLALRAFRTAWDASETAPPEVPAALEQTGSTFQSLVTRLDRLGGYQPELTLAWEQSTLEYQPAVRVHDNEVILGVPYLAAGTVPEQAVEINLLTEVPVAVRLLPTYRLDGTVQLRRSRFLHLDLDLEWRVDDPARFHAAPLPGPPGDDGVLDEEGAEDDADPVERPPPAPFRIHRLRQSRQVETDTMIYFDSEVLGVLARVTALQDPAPETE